MSKKGQVSIILAIIIAIAFLAGGIAVGYYYGIKKATTATTTTEITTTTKVGVTTTTQDISDWKTYTNGTYGFSFKYPATYKYKDYDLSSQEGRGFFNEFAVQIGTNIPQSDTEAVKSTIHINVSATGAKDDLNAPNGMDPVSSADATVGGIKGMKYNGTNGGVEYVIIKNDRRYEIGVMSDASQSTKDNFAKILSTFQFTK